MNKRIGFSLVFLFIAVIVLAQHNSNTFSISLGIRNFNRLGGNTHTSVFFNDTIGGSNTTTVTYKTRSNVSPVVNVSYQAFPFKSGALHAINVCGQIGILRENRVTEAIGNELKSYLAKNPQLSAVSRNEVRTINPYFTLFVGYKINRWNLFAGCRTNLMDFVKTTISIGDPVKSKVVLRRETNFNVADMGLFPHVGVQYDVVGKLQVGLYIEKPEKFGNKQWDTIWGLNITYLLN